MFPGGCGDPERRGQGGDHGGMGLGRARGVESRGHMGVRGSCYCSNSLSPPGSQAPRNRCWHGKSGCGWGDRLSPERLAVTITVLEAHLLQFAAPVELIVPAMCLFSEVLHVHPDQHLPELHEVAVILVLHWKWRAHEHQTGTRPPARRGQGAGQRWVSEADPRGKTGSRWARGGWRTGG